MIIRKVDINNLEREKQELTNIIKSGQKEIHNLRDTSQRLVFDIDEMESDLSDLKHELESNRTTIKESMGIYIDEVFALNTTKHKIEEAKGAKPAHTQPSDKPRPESEQTIITVRKPRKKVKRGYFVVEHQEAGYGLAVVAYSIRQSKKMFWNHPDTNVDGYAEWINMRAEWINMRAEWKRDANVENLDIGVIEDLKTGLLAGIFEYIEEGFVACDQCGEEGSVELHEGKILCEECIEKLQEAIIRV